MKKLTVSTCCIATAMFLMPASAEICTDFDDDFNVIEFECGTSVKDAIKKHDAEKQAEQERIRADEKAKREAEEAEKERIRAEERAKREAEETEKERIRAEERAKREAEEAEKERIRAEEDAKSYLKKHGDKRAENLNEYWGRRFFHPFIALGYQNLTPDIPSNIYIEDSYPEPLHEYYIQRQNITNPVFKLGLVHRSQNSNWEYGLQLVTFEYETQADKNHDSFIDEYEEEGREYILDATFGYNVWNRLNLYVGLGLVYHKTTQEHRYSNWYDFYEYRFVTKNNSTILFRFTAGTEYWFWNNFGVYLEYIAEADSIGFSGQQNNTGYSIGMKFRF